jgi:putative transposase
VVFASDADYQYYLDTLVEWKEKLGCQIYAFCLMTNHVHLIINPGKDVTTLSQLMKRVNGRQTRYVNKIELNPVRAGMVSRPEAYPWSSYQSKVGIRSLKWLDYDSCYMELDSSRENREKKYEQWVNAVIPQGEWELIRESLQRGQLTGSKKFVDQIEKKLNQRVEFRGPGKAEEKRKINLSPFYVFMLFTFY